MKFSSALLSSTVDNFARLPGIGKKTALRLALHLVQKDPQLAKALSVSLTDAVDGILECRQCHNLSDGPVCHICADPKRDHSLICLVEGVRDVMAIEDTAHYRGMYHVLGGVISPIDGIGPDKLNIASLMSRISEYSIREIIMAINPTIEGETTMYFISQRLADLDIKISVIARGVSFGGELEYADEHTLGKSILSRRPYILDAHLVHPV
ncbi:MAG TPA: recombination mediator RecR [Saprospiraceae bacterium]|nr:recombination mediator RecR [Saprospiraceae bacterium]